MKTSIFYYLLGYVFMWIRYRDRNKIGEILQKNYNGNYREVGFLVIWKPFMVVFLILISALVFGAIVSIFKFGIT